MPFNFDATKVNPVDWTAVHMDDPVLIERYGRMRFDITAAMLAISQSEVYELSDDNVPQVLSFIDEQERAMFAEAENDDDRIDVVVLHNAIRSHVRKLVGIHVYTTR